MISPFKAVIDGAYRAVEERLHAAVRLRFGLPARLPRALRQRIKKADQVAAYWEAVRLAGFCRGGGGALFRPAGTDRRRRDRRHCSSRGRRSRPNRAISRAFEAPSPQRPLPEGRHERHLRLPAVAPRRDGRAHPARATS